ncbi:hypothetical protein [Sulfurovum sp.]|uniref:hypothetical protein n=1 Tax=Sulfurovum sp. TaxID=1969726 RepID=UPI003563AD63
MEDILSILYRFFTSLFQWQFIYAFLLAIGSGFIWIVTLGKYPNKNRLSDYGDYIVILGFFVIIGILNLSYWIWKWTT